jgi:DNA polymerase III epsilon subunit family exonuclease
MTPRRSDPDPGPPPALDDADFDQLDIAVVDLETTGLSADRGDRVCEIGIVRTRGGAVMETFGTLVEPTVPVSAGAYAVNGISPAMLANAPLFGDIMGTIEPLLRNSVIVAYNAPFDMSFLHNEFRLNGTPVLTNPVVDVLVLARQLLPGRPRYPQSSVAALLNISSPVSHRALEDAMVTAKILMHFLSMLRAYDLRTLGDLRRRDIASLVRAKRVEKISAALASGEDLWIRYLSPTDGEITQRIVTPAARTAPTDSRSPGGEFRGFCHVLQAPRSFRVDYILDIRPVSAGRF